MAVMSHFSAIRRACVPPVTLTLTPKSATFQHYACTTKRTSSNIDYRPARTNTRSDEGVCTDGNSTARHALHCHCHCSRLPRTPDRLRPARPVRCNAKSQSKANSKLQTPNSPRPRGQIQVCKNKIKQQCIVVPCERKKDHRERKERTA